MFSPGVVATDAPTRSEQSEARDAEKGRVSRSKAHKGDGFYGYLFLFMDDGCIFPMRGRQENARLDFSDAFVHF